MEDPITAYVYGTTTDALGRPVTVTCGTAIVCNMNGAFYSMAGGAAKFDLVATNGVATQQASAVVSNGTCARRDFHFPA